MLQIDSQDYTTYCQTRVIQFERYWYRWSIHDYNEENLNSKYMSKSYHFNAGFNNCYLTWIYSKKMLSIHFDQCNLTNDDLNKRVNAGLVIKDGDKIVEHTNRSFLIESDDQKILLFIFDVDVESCIGSLKKRPNYNMQIECFIPDYSKSLPLTVLDLTSLLKTRKFSDITLITTNEYGERHEFPAHKNILSNHSKIFENIFEKDESNDKIEIQGFDSFVMREVLYYMYSGLINYDVVWEMSEELLKVADHYGLDKLKEIIGKVLEQNVSICNAFQYLIMGDDYKIPKFKKKAINIIIDIEDFTKSTGFNMISESHMHLMKELVVAMANK